MDYSLFYQFYDSPIGMITLCANRHAIKGLYFGANSPLGAEKLDTTLLSDCRTQLDEYFIGKRKVFSLPLSPNGTVFQQKIWGLLKEIPYGETRSYKQIAERYGNTRACRAVGMANNRNPISIIVPCHRVVGADGSLVGYGGGLSIKKQLLELEEKFK